MFEKYALVSFIKYVSFIRYCIVWLQGGKTRYQGISSGMSRMNQYLCRFPNEVLYGNQTLCLLPEAAAC